jgi:UDP-N-acetylmuramoyl-tripeptide--D-alanyl-D-alanine ligase
MRIKIKEKELFKKLIKRNFNYELKNIDSFCIDSRLVKKNDIFMPIKGNYIDPHNFISDVLKNKPAMIFSEQVYDNKNIIKVDSTKKVLNEISKKWIKHFKQTVIAITGSNGKTTTKEILTSIFSYIYKSNNTKGNYNSSIGLPVNLFNFSLDAEINIIEMGASKPNEIDQLCQIVKPHYSVITNIHNAHIANFNTFEELVKTKLSIFKNTINQGLIFENNDDINISKYCEDKKNKITFGFKNSKVDFFGKLKLSDNDFQFSVNGKNIHNKYLNKIMAKNILASYSIARTYGIDHENIVKALKNFNFVKGRGRHINKNGYLIIDDTYNANFESFKSGIDSFMNITNKGRKILVIGDMKELGVRSKQDHINLGKYINKHTPDIVFSYGELVSETINEIQNSNTISKHFKEMKTLIENLKTDLMKDDAIYLKASRSLNFENIIKEI